jgi:subtilisin
VLERTETQVRVIDSISENGAKLVEATPEAAAALRAEQPGVRIVPVVYYHPALARPFARQASIVQSASPAPSVTFTVYSRTDRAAVRDAMVVAFTNFKNRTGAQGRTDAAGRVTLPVGGSKSLERVYVYPRNGYWGLLRHHLAAASQELEVTPLDLAKPDGLRHYYSGVLDDAGEGVRVAVLDTGIGSHPDLQVEGGLNTVPDEDPADYGDNGEGHGTHVAGIIAARGIPPQGIRGLAPGVSLRSYRVFPQGSEDASNWAIAKAIDAAVADGCDLLNLSLGGGPDDPAVRDAIEDARSMGAVVIAAAGNDDREPVAFPASEPSVIAVSALGRRGTFPEDSVAAGFVGDPFGTDPDDFIASFSNVGPEIDLTGPGVGVVSTVPGGFAALDGTSMACPAVVGMSARIIAQSPDVLGMPRNQERSDAIGRSAFLAARLLGFGATFEGRGLLL